MAPDGGLSGDGAAADAVATGCGSEWYRVVLQPHVPARATRDRHGSLYTLLFPDEVVEVSEVRDGWARLSPAELRRRRFPEKDEAWAFIDGTSLGIGKLLEPVEAPPEELTRRGVKGEVKLTLASGGRRVFVNAEADDAAEVVGTNRHLVEMVVAQNDLAWEMLQARRKLLLQEPSCFTAHDGQLAPGDDLLVATITPSEAKVKCATLQDCEGLTWRGGPDEQGAVEIRFKTRWRLLQVDELAEADGEAPRFTSLRPERERWTPEVAKRVIGAGWTRAA